MSHWDAVEFFACCFSIFSFVVVFGVQLHTMGWYRQQQRDDTDSDLSKPIFVTAVSCMSFLSIYCLNWFLILLLDLLAPFSKHICFYQWHNDAIYYLGKGCMFAFYFARLHEIFDKSYYSISRRSMALLCVASIIFFAGIGVDQVVNTIQQYDSFQGQGTRVSDCDSLSHAYSSKKQIPMHSLAGIIGIVGEIVIAVILLRLFVSRLIRLHLRQKAAHMDGFVHTTQIEPRTHLRMRHTSTGSMSGTALTQGYGPIAPLGPLGALGGAGHVRAYSSSTLHLYKKQISASSHLSSFPRHITHTVPAHGLERIQSNAAKPLETVQDVQSKVRPLDSKHPAGASAPETDEEDESAVTDGTDASKEANTLAANIAGVVGSVVSVTSVASVASVASVSSAPSSNQTSAVSSPPRPPKPGKSSIRSKQAIANLRVATSMASTQDKADNKNEDTLNSAATPSASNQTDAGSAGVTGDDTEKLPTETLVSSDVDALPSEPNKNIETATNLDLPDAAHAAEPLETVAAADAPEAPDASDGSEPAKNSINADATEASDCKLDDAHRHVANTTTASTEMQSIQESLALHVLQASQSLPETPHTPQTPNNIEAAHHIAGSESLTQNSENTPYKALSAIPTASFHVSGGSGGSEEYVYDLNLFRVPPKISDSNSARMYSMPHPAAPSGAHKSQHSDNLQYLQHTHNRMQRSQRSQRQRSQNTRHTRDKAHISNMSSSLDRNKHVSMRSNSMRRSLTGGGMNFASDVKNDVNHHRIQSHRSNTMTPAVSRQISISAPSTGNTHYNLTYSKAPAPVCAVAIDSVSSLTRFEKKLSHMARRSVSTPPSPRSKSKSKSKSRSHSKTRSVSNDFGFGSAAAAAALMHANRHAGAGASASAGSQQNGKHAAHTRTQTQKDETGSNAGPMERQQSLLGRQRTISMSAVSAMSAVSSVVSDVLSRSGSDAGQKRRDFLELATRSTNLMILSLVSTTVPCLMQLVFFAHWQYLYVFWLVDSFLTGLSIYLTFVFSKRLYDRVCICHYLIDPCYFNLLFDVCCINKRPEMLKWNCCSKDNVEPEDTVEPMDPMDTMDAIEAMHAMNAPPAAMGVNAIANNSSDSHVVELPHDAEKRRMEPMEVEEPGHTSRDRSDASSSAGMDENVYEKEQDAVPDENLSRGETKLEPHPKIAQVGVGGLSAVLEQYEVSVDANGRNEGVYAKLPSKRSDVNTAGRSNVLEALEERN